MMHIGSKEVDIFLFYQPIRQLLGFRAIVTTKGQQIELEQASNITNLVIPAFVGAEIKISFGMRQDRLITFQLHVEQYFFQINGGYSKG